MCRVAIRWSDGWCQIHINTFVLSTTWMLSSSASSTAQNPLNLFPFFFILHHFNTFIVWWLHHWRWKTCAQTIFYAKIHPCMLLYNLKQFVFFLFTVHRNKADYENGCLMFIMFSAQVISKDSTVHNHFVHGNHFKSSRNCFYVFWCNFSSEFVLVTYKKAEH